MNAARAGLLLTVLAVLLPAATAQPFTVDVDVTNQQVNPADNESATFNITVTNHGDDATDVTLGIGNNKPSWFDGPYPYSARLDPGGSMHSVLYVTPGREAVQGNYGITVSVNGNIEALPSFSVVRDRDLIVTGIGTDRTTYLPGSTVNVTLTVRNVMSSETSENAYRVAVDLGDANRTVSLPALDPAEEETVRAELDLDRFAAGVMTVQGRVETISGVRHDTRTATIDVRRTEDLAVEHEGSFALVASHRAVHVANRGNVESNATTVSARVPFYLSYFTGFSTSPDDVSSSGGSTVYTWNVDALEPGESVRFEFTVNYWAPVAFLALLVIAAVLAVRSYRSPTISKSSDRKEGKHSVHLRVKNRSGSVLEDVVVTDTVPSIASLIEKFDSSPPERIREGDEQTEIEWHLGQMDPGEERILTYEISAQIQVEGEVTLPSAHLSYTVDGDEAKRHSHPVAADFT